MKKSLFAAVAAMFLTIVASHQTQSAEPIGKYPECLKETALPDYKIAPITEPVGSAADFLGVWGGGKWGDTLCHTLVVKRVIKNGDAAKAYIIYSWGKGYNFTPGYDDVTGEIKDGKLSFTLSRGEVKVEYVIASDGTLRGIYERFTVARGTMRNTATLHKQK